MFSQFISEPSKTYGGEEINRKPCVFGIISRKDSRKSLLQSAEKKGKYWLFYKNNSKKKKEHLYVLCNIRGATGALAIWHVNYIYNIYIYITS